MKTCSNLFRSALFKDLLRLGRSYAVSLPIVGAQEGCARAGSASLRRSMAVPAKEDK